MINMKMKTSILMLAVMLTFAAGCGSNKNTEKEMLPASAKTETQSEEISQTESDAETQAKETTQSVIMPVGPGTVNTGSSAQTSASWTNSASQSEIMAEDGYEPRDEQVYATTNVNIRSKASTDSEKVGFLEAGASIRRTGYTSQWSKVEYNGTTCYVASEYLSAEPLVSVNSQAQATAGSSLWTGDITTLSTNVFSGISDYVDRDALNVPNGCYYLTKLYSKYNAQFIEDTSKNVIYLTMDEGYEAGYTPQILQTLREKNVKATFFVTKEFYNSNPEYIQQMIEDGHTVGNHTCNHLNMPTLSLEQQTDEIMNLHNIIKEQFGYEMKLFRFPEGSTSEQSLALVESLGYKSVFWSFHYLDYTDEQKDPAEALQLCIDSLHPGAIYLLHAKSSTNTQILGDWIDAVRAAGYEFGGGLPTD